jgi:CheY-like chemotaxis protein
MFSKAEFTKQIVLALDNLHDFVYLRGLPVTAALGVEDEPVDISVRRLQSSVLDAIERLNPDDHVSPRAKERRPYAIAYGRYVQGVTTAELADELAISIRQLRREHKRAVGAIVDLLWQQWRKQLEVSALSEDNVLDRNRHEAAASEAETLIARGQRQTQLLYELVEGILATLGPLAVRRGTILVNKLTPEMEPIYADRVVLRQALLELAAYALDRAVGGSVTVAALAGNTVGLCITAVGSLHPAMRAGVGFEISRRLITSAGGRIDLDETPAGWRARVVLAPVSEASIVIADDNAGLVELFRRYLAGYPYRVWSVRTPEEIFALLPQAHPDLILLDVMMPEQDGWEMLIRLRAARETSAIPIIICSVLNEPEIAYSLGAADYLTKPVTQHDLLAKLDQWCAARNRRHGGQERL